MNITTTRALRMFAAALWLFVALPMGLFAVTSTPDNQEPQVPNLTSKSSITLGGAPATTLTDGSYTTYYTAPPEGETTIEITAPPGQTIGSIYLVWNSPPLGGWQLQTPEGSSTLGQNGFLHDYNLLPQPQNSITLRFAGAAQLCDVYILAPAEVGQALPTWVQLWQPPVEKADMLLLPTHADDEHLYFGGIMPAYALGQQLPTIQVAYMVNHSTEPYRQHELLNGLWAAGMQNYPVIPSFPDIFSDSLDHAKTIYDEEEIKAYQTELIRRFKPQVIIAHDINGEYGHGAHMLNTYCLQQVIETSNNSTAFADSYQKYGGWDVPKTYIHLYKQNAWLLDIEKPLDNADGKTALDLAVAAFAQHRSQQQYFKVELGGPYDLRAFGLYRSTVGPDVAGGDFFENISLYANAKPEPPPVIEPETNHGPTQEPLPDPPAQRPLVSNGMVIIIIGLIAASTMLLLYLFTKSKQK